MSEFLQQPPELKQDPWNLSRFVQAQSTQYQQALREIQNGRKQTHWMWYIFPQLRQLGRSSMAHFYGIENREEAMAYLAHPILGPRLVEISRALMELQEQDPLTVMGSPDHMKLRSCMTLFALLPGADPVFQAVLQKYFGGRQDRKTLVLLGCAV